MCKLEVIFGGVFFPLNPKT